MDIGERIKRRREELGMSQDELARAAGYKSRSSINKIELDGRGLPQNKVVAIARALKVTPSYLMGWEDEEVAKITARQEEFMECYFELSEQKQKITERLLCYMKALTNEEAELITRMAKSLTEDEK